MNCTFLENNIIITKKKTLPRVRLNANFFITTLVPYKNGFSSIIYMNLIIKLLF